MALADATPFGQLCRKLRLERKLTQLEAGRLCGLAGPTIGTIEGSKYRVVGPERAAIMADAYGLVGDARKQFLELHEQTQLSPFSERRKEHWKKRNEQRSKIRSFDGLHYAACELAIRFIDAVPVGEACRCDFGGGSYGDAKPCELCFLLEKVGVFGGLGDQEKTLMRLTAIMQKLRPRVFPEPKTSAHH